MILQEGKAKLRLDKPVFYNPVQEFNRDLTYDCFLRFIQRILCVMVHNLKIVLKGDSVRILDALSATGLRALRFAQEVEHVDFVLANDFSENAVQIIKDHIVLNGLENKVIANFGDAIETMMNHRSINKRFHAVDLDPYGSASIFLDSAVQCVAENGILMVTCTDMAVLCGNTPETCYNKYGSTTVRMKCCHELALRILLRSIDSHANRYSRYVEPLLSISVDFYIRVFVRVHTGARMAKESGTKVGNVLVCSGCHSMEITPILRKAKDEISLKFCASVVRQTLMGAENKCIHCGSSVHQAGPIYIGPIHSRPFVKLSYSIENTPEEERLGTHNRLLGVLTNVSEELDVPLYYEHDQLFNVVKCSVPKLIAVKSAILNAGYKVSGSHCNPRALKTDAPTSFLWDIYINRQKSVEFVKSILWEIKFGLFRSEVNFQLHPKATFQTKTDQMVRFQCNKGKNWGPKAKAKGSINSTYASFYVKKKIPEDSVE
ncbi:unnamed protein product [Angiostrongylus costaricensis]|uniref:tRNA (guanine(26)-N(2))-dimethyltransferase n=1 Tax=Angiostrongylus costaricensis TaxID=334426 RepID=A0A158PEH9_ANGCS|nr:unnamed protein product [Angiostrongylus costaricensis]